MVWPFAWLCLLLFFLLSPLYSLSSPPSPFTPTPPSCHPQEASALLHFRNSFSINNDSSYFSYCASYLGIANPNGTMSWDMSRDCCTWSGVTCDDVTDKVIRLDLKCGGLQGIIYSNNSLFSLTHLQALILSSNDFDGSKISPQFARFRSMIHLDLSDSGFTGQVPLEFSYLSSLVTLDLSWNRDLRLETFSLKQVVANLTSLRELSLSGVNMSYVSPNSFMNLSAPLTFLDLSDSELKGEFPENIFHLPNLQYLKLSYNNNLTGSLPRYNWTSQLRNLSLSSTGFQLDLPYLIRNSKYLNHLEVSNCFFKGSFPSLLVNLTLITSLDISSNNFGGQIPWDSLNLAKMQFLDLSFNKFEGQLPEICNSTKQTLLCDSSKHQLVGPVPFNLKFLSLDSNSLNGTIPSWLYSLPSLQILLLSQNQFTGHIGQISWKSLDIIDLSSNKLLGPLPIPPPSTFAFLISNNQLVGEISSSFCNLRRIEVLDLSNNSLSGNIPPCLGNNTLISVLDLRLNQFHGTIPNTFAKGNRLSTLNLNRNQLEGPLPQSLVNCESLEFLDVGNNKLNGSFPFWLDSLPKLQVLILRSNAFAGPISNPKVGIPFQKLKIIDLSNNEFTGLLPSKYFQNFVAMMNVHTDDLEYMMYKLFVMSFNQEYYYQDTVVVAMKGINRELTKIQTMLVHIDFSSNNFTGEIPELIGKLNSLKGLNLSHNKLTGVIPPLLGNLSNLEGLDLSCNNLSGKIPLQLEAGLNQLEFLNLSNNKLEGPIPQGKQFNTFNNDSYSGNAGLCGFPLSKSCGNDEAQIDQDDNRDDDDHEDDDRDDDEMIEWKVVMMGYGSGMVIGISVGYMVLFSRSLDYWFLKRFGRGGRCLSARRARRRSN